MTIKGSAQSVGKIQGVGRLRPLLFVASLISGGVQISGCALTTEYVTLSYRPQANVAKIERADSVTVQVRVDDVRSRRDRVSSKKNGYGMEMAPFIAKTDVVQLVKEALESELRDRGFTLGPAAATVSVELHKFYTEVQIGFWSGTALGEVEMNVQVLKSDGSILLSKFVAGQGSVPGLQVMSDEDVQKSLEAALDDAMSKLMQDPAFVNALFKAATP